MVAKGPSAMCNLQDQEKTPIISQKQLKWINVYIEMSYQHIHATTAILKESPFIENFNLDMNHIWSELLWRS